MNKKAKHRRKLAPAMAAMVFSAAANAAPYTVDTFLFSADLGNSGDATELAALATFLGVPVTDLVQDVKVNTPAPALVANVNAPGEWYIDVDPREPGYFLLKFGVGGTGVADDHYYFANTAELTKLVWSNDQVNYLTGGNCGARNQNACNIGRLSHYVLYSEENGGGGGPPDPLPEPGSVALMGAGLAAMAANRRRKTAA